MAALFKTKDIKKWARNISQWCKWSWKMRVTNILLLGQHLMPGYPHPAHPLPHKHTHQQKGHCLSNDLWPPHLQPTHPFFSNFHHDEYTSFLITKLLNNKSKYISKVLKVHINRIQLYLNSASPRKQCKLKP